MRLIKNVFVNLWSVPEVYTQDAAGSPTLLKMETATGII